MNLFSEQTSPCQVKETIPFLPPMVKKTTTIPPPHHYHSSLFHRPILLPQVSPPPPPPPSPLFPLPSFPPHIPLLSLPFTSSPPPRLPQFLPVLHPASPPPFPSPVRNPSLFPFLFPRYQLFFSSSLSTRPFYRPSTFPPFVLPSFFTTSSYLPLLYSSFSIRCFTPFAASLLTPLVVTPYFFSFRYPLPPPTPPLPPPPPPIPLTQTRRVHF